VWAGGSYEGTTLQALTARAAGGPFVVSIDVENIVTNYGYVRHPIRERALAEVDHFCVTSTAAAAVLRLDGVEEERISVVPPVVDMPVLPTTSVQQLRAAGRSLWGIADDAFLVLFIGRCVWQKGLHTIAAAAATLAHDPDASNIHWLLVGDGDYLPTASSILAHYNAHDRVHLTGWIDDRRLALASADVLVVPSNPLPTWLEQFGRVIPEAMHFGLPVIGTASGAIPEAVATAGVIVPPADHVALAASVVEMSRPGVREPMVAEARRLAAERYSVKAYVERIAEALERGRERHRQVFKQARI